MDNACHGGKTDPGALEIAPPVKALEGAEVCEIPMNELERVAQQVPGLQHQLLRIIGKSMELDQDHLGMLGRRHAAERVLLFIHGLSERLRSLGRPHDQFSLPMSREEILGMARRTLYDRMKSLGLGAAKE